MASLRQFRFLVALRDTLSFSRAAEVCHVTQSTLSTGLKELERSLGVQLAERSRHAVLMTRIGEEIADRAAAVLADVAEIEELARSGGGEDGLVRLGVIPTIGPFLVPRALPVIRGAMPGMKVYLREELTASLLDGLTEGRLDIALIALPFDLPRQVVTEPLFDDGYQLAMPRTHPLADRREASAGDLRGASLLLLEKGHCLQRHALSSFPGANLSEDPGFAATSLVTLVAMVEEGLGFTLLPDLAVAAGATRGYDVSLAALPTARPRHVVLAWRATTARSELFREIAGQLRRAHADLMAAPVASELRLASGQ